MTTPFYDANLYPGMIADYKVPKDALKDWVSDRDKRALASGRPIYKSRFAEPKLYHWANEHLTTPFAFNWSSTAHWHTHIQVGCALDCELVSTLLGGELTTSGHWGNDYQETVQEKIGVKQYLERRGGHIFYGENVSLEMVSEYLKFWPIPIRDINELIRDQDDKDRMAALQEGAAELWQFIIGPYRHFVTIERNFDEELKEWCEHNIQQGWKAMGHRRQELPLHVRFLNDSKYKAVVAFADKTEAAKFKMFFG